MVPPRGRMPEISLIVSSKDFSGQMRPSKPSGMPMTFHPYLRVEDLVGARMTALRPGASPPPVAIPMQRMSDIETVVGRWSLVPSQGSGQAKNSRWPSRTRISRFYDNTLTLRDGNLLVGVEAISDRLRCGGRCGA